MFYKYLGNFLFRVYKKIKSIYSNIQKSKFAACGENVYVGDDCEFTCENIYVGNNVHIGARAFFIATLSKIYIGDYTMMGSNVTIYGGDHRTDVVGEFMYNVKEKLEKNDKDVIIERDVWIGANVTILKGVTIGEGSIIGAGSLVTRSLQPYSIYTGVPELRIRKRFSEEQIESHSQIIYSSR